jgi:hypothetical protein
MATEPELVLETEDDEDITLHRHPLNPVSLAFGVMFFGLGLTFLTGDVRISQVGDGWLWAGTLLSLSVLLLSVAVSRHRAR